MAYNSRNLGQLTELSESSRNRTVKRVLQAENITADNKTKQLQEYVEQHGIPIQALKELAQAGDAESCRYILQAAHDNSATLDNELPGISELADMCCDSILDDEKKSIDTLKKATNNIATTANTPMAEFKQALLSDEQSQIKGFIGLSKDPIALFEKRIDVAAENVQQKKGDYDFDLDPGVKLLVAMKDNKELMQEVALLSEKASSVTAKRAMTVAIEDIAKEVDKREGSKSNIAYQLKVKQNASSNQVASATAPKQTSHKDETKHNVDKGSAKYSWRDFLPKTIQKKLASEKSHKKAQAQSFIDEVNSTEIKKSSEEDIEGYLKQLTVKNANGAIDDFATQLEQSKNLAQTWDNKEKLTNLMKASIDKYSTTTVGGKEALVDCIYSDKNMKRVLDKAGIQRSSLLDTSLSASSSVGKKSSVPTQSANSRPGTAKVGADSMLKAAAAKKEMHRPTVTREPRITQPSRPGRGH